MDWLIWRSFRPSPCSRVNTQETKMPSNTMSDPRDIIIEFSGWCRLSPENARFQCTEDDRPIISGVEWQALSEDERSNYVLEDVVAAIRDSDDNEWIYIDPFVEEDSH